MQLSGEQGIVSFAWRGLPKTWPSPDAVPTAPEAKTSCEGRRDVSEAAGEQGAEKDSRWKGRLLLLLLMMFCRIRGGRSKAEADVEESFIKTERRKEVSGSYKEGVSEGEAVGLGVARSTTEREGEEEAGDVGVRIVVVVDVDIVVDIGVVVVGCIH